MIFESLDFFVIMIVGIFNFSEVIMYYVNIWDWTVDLGLILTILGAIGIIGIPTAIILYYKQKMQNAITLAKLDKVLRYIDGLPQSNIEVKKLFEAGKKAMVRGDYKKAKEYLIKALKQTDIASQRSAIIIILGNIEDNLGEYFQAWDFYHEALDISTNSNDIPGQCWALNGLGSISMKLGKSNSSESYYERGIQLAKNGVFEDSNEVYAVLLSNLGLLFKEKGDFKRAFEMHLKAYSVNKKINNLQGIADNLNNIGIILYNKNDFDNAIINYKESIKIYNMIGDYSNKAKVMNNMGLLYLEERKFDKALSNFLNALNLFRRIGYKLGEANTLCNIGNTLMRKGNLCDALLRCNEALNLHKQIGNANALANTFHIIGWIYYEKSSFKYSFKNFHQAIIINRETENVLGEADNISCMGNVLMKAKRYKCALGFLLKALDLHVSINYRIGVAKDHKNIGIVLINLKDLTKAKKHLEQALNIFKILNVVDEIESTSLIIMNLTKLL